MTSCSTKQDQYLYDQVGFDVGEAPTGVKNPNAPVKVVPDYYYRQPIYQVYQQPILAPQQQYVPQQQMFQSQAQPYPQAQPQQPYYAVSPQQQMAPQAPQAPQATYYMAPSQQQIPPGSRYYSNPYDIPPSRMPHHGHDVDQYHVPATRANSGQN